MADLNLQQLHGLKKYDIESTLALLAGLLTIPALQANTIRLEAAVHLAAASCKGNRRAGRAEIQRWLNTELARIRHREDPAEDVFVGNVITPEGNRRVLQGVWEASDYYLQGIIDVLLSRDLPEDCKRFLQPVLALLTVSEEIAARMGLRRWQLEPGSPQSPIRLPAGDVLKRAASAVCFSEEQLSEMGISPELLAPFILRDSDRPQILTQTIGNTLLERRPLVRVGRKLICALPNGISPAIRRFVIGGITQAGHLGAFAGTLAELQFSQLRTDLQLQLREFAMDLEFPEPEGEMPSLHTLVAKYDADKYLHVLFLHGRLNRINTHGFSGMSNFPSSRVEGLARYAASVAEWCKSQPDFREGSTLFVLGGAGEPGVLGLNRFSDPWHVSLISIPNLCMLAKEYDQPLMRYLKFLKQREWVEKHGLKFLCFDDYFLYCHWRQSDSIPVPHGLPLRPGSVCPVLGGSAAEVRAEVRSLVDRHLLPSVRGSPVLVRRLHSDSLFASQRSKTIYASPHSAAAGLLAGAIVTRHGVSWFTARATPGQSLLDVPYRIWDGFIDLFENLVVALEGMPSRERRDVIEVRLDCSRIASFTETTASDPVPALLEPEVSINPGSGVATVTLPAGFLHYFRQSDNTGERLLLMSIARGLAGLHGNSDDGPWEESLRSLLDRVIEDPGIRVIHAFHTTDPVDLIRQQKKNSKLRFVSEMDYRFLGLGLCDGLVRCEDGTTLESKESCNDLLHDIADSIFKRLRRTLRTLDRTSVIRILLERQEAIFADRRHWARTARAVMALHPDSEEGIMAANQREAQRSNTGLAARSIMEIAICECPTSGGRPMSSWDADEVLALMLAVLDTASCSEAIYHDLAEPHIEVFPNGEFAMDHSFREQVMNPFLQAYNREQFEEAAQDYEDLYGDDDQSEPNESEGSVLPHDLAGPFQAEFGLTPEQAGRGMGELVNLAVFEEDLVVGTTVARVRQRLIDHCGYSRGDCESFFRSFGLMHRPNWEQPPQGCKARDIRPWRYGRKLSAVVRPLLIFGEQDDDTIFYSVSMLRAGFTYLVGKIREGQLSQGFFTSREMKSYIGKINDQLGHAFENEVAERFREAGWRSRRRVPMSELGAPAKLGDIDVLAWKEDGQVRVVECKRLQLARSVAEIAEVCRKFNGEARNELDKHLRRLEWIQENPASLKGIVGFAPGLEKMEDRIVTSNRVPLTYLTSLPIEPGKFVPLPELQP